MAWHIAHELGGAKFARPQYSDWWLRDTYGAYLDDNYTVAHPTNCHCMGYTQSAPGEARGSHQCLSQSVSVRVSLHLDMHRLTLLSDSGRLTPLGPLWDFRQPRVSQYFMEEMVTPMISSDSVDGIFFGELHATLCWK